MFLDSDKAYIDTDYYESELGGGHDVLLGDVIIAGLGDDNNHVGRACVAPVDLGRAMVKADCYRYRLNTDAAQPEFIAFQLSSTASEVGAALSTGTTRSRVNLSATTSRKIALPPLPEQRVIVNHVNSMSEPLEEAIVKINDAIALLREYRTALISAAVTGKIDVRSEVA